MKYSISNIAWKEISIDTIGPILKDSLISGIEIAPTLIWPKFPAVTDFEIEQFLHKISSFDLKISGFQSLMFGHPEYQILDSDYQVEIVNHFEKVITVAKKAGAKILVFGSPRNRIKGDRNETVAIDDAVNFFKKIEPLLMKNEITLTLEPNSPQYGADFMTSYAEVIKICRIINSAWIRPQIDTGCMSMVNEDAVRAYQSMVPGHIHISEPNLEPVVQNEPIRIFINHLITNNFQGWVVLEMLTNSQLAENQIINAIKWLPDSNQSSKVFN